MAKIDDSVKKKVPELRFPGFTYDWEERKLSDIADRFDNLRVPITASDRKPGDTPYYGANGIQDYVEGFTHNGEFILVAEDGANDLKNYPVQYVNGKVWVNNHAHVLQGKKTITDNKFLMNAIKNFNIEPFLVGGGRAKLNADVMMKLNILLPTFVEQEKIGSLFSLLDKTIALHQRKLDLLKEQKKGYLQKMFPKNGAKVPELRFAGFADDWEDRKLGDTLTELKSGLSRMLSNNDIGLPVVRANNINDGQFNIDSDVKYWYVNDPQGANTVNYLIRKNDILINFINSEAKMGTATIVENTPIRDTIYTTNILRARLKKEYDSYYWFALTQINQYKINIKIITKPAVNQASFTTVDFKKLNFMFPNLKEQQKIGSFFKQLDDTIDLHQRKLDLLKEQKKGYLQKMFV